MTRPTFKNFKNKALSNPDVKAEYDALEPVYELRRKLIALRTKKGITQNELATIMKTNKSNISRLECGEKLSYPTIATIDKYARALGYKITIDFKPI